MVVLCIVGIGAAIATDYHRRRMSCITKLSC